MEVKFLKAGKGDSILVSSKREHLLIDGGDDSKYLLKELDTIFNNGECLKYVIITHHDSDHIKGIIDFFNELKTERYGNPTKFVKKVFFNSPRVIKEIKTSEESDKLSYRQAFEVENQINELSLDCSSILIDTSDKLLVGDTKITCLSPSREILDNYKEKAPEKYLSRYSGGDWSKSLKELSPFITDNSIDKSPANLTSIVLLIQNKRKKGLLTGDVTPQRFEVISKILFKDNGNKKLKLDFIKLPHHGSHRSITKEIISKFNCDTYVISTNGLNHFLPNKKAFLKVLEYHEEDRNNLNFLFN